MKKILVLSAIFSMGIAVGASGVLPGIAEAAWNGMAFLESSAIQIVNSDAENATQEAKADAKNVEEKNSEVEAADVSEAEAPAGKTYWVGATIGPIPEPVLAHIAEGTIPEGKGLFLMEVLKDSPAAKAGLKAYDVVLKANGEVVDAEAFVEKVRASKGAKVTCEVLRAGKTQTIEVTPEERPAMPQPGFWGPRGPRDPNAPQPPRRGMRRWMEQEGMEVPEMPGFQGLWEDGAFPEDLPIPEEMREMLKNQREAFQKQGLGFVPQMPQVQPGMEEQQNFGSQMKVEVTPNGTRMSRSMTTIEDGEPLNVSIQKTGDEPAKILVEWKDESYETTEEKLDAIPEEIRGKVEAFLKSGSVTIHSDGITAALPAPAEKAEAASKADSDPDSDSAEKPAEKDAEKEIPIQKKDVINLK